MVKISPEGVTVPEQGKPSGRIAPQPAEGIMVDLRRDFWILETGKGQQAAQLHERYMMMIVTMMTVVLGHKCKHERKMGACILYVHLVY